VGNKFQTGKQSPNRETNWETIWETIWETNWETIWETIWETNVMSDPHGYASSTRPTMPYVEVLAETAVVVGLAKAAQQ